MKKTYSKKILVTGGGGFLGSHLCKKLLSLGHKVICLDNFYTGSFDNIKNLKDENFEVINQNILDKIDITVDEIYNLASPASPVHYQKNPILTIKTNILGSLNLLELSRKLNIKIFQASTSEVYGDPLVHPQNEDYFGNVNTTGIRACYDEGKRAAETLFFDYNRMYKIPIKVVRIFNTYGPNMSRDDGRVISNFIIQALMGKDLTIYGDGNQTRSFCYVDDLIDGFIAMMKSDDNILGPINLGNPFEYTVVEVAKKIIELTGSSSSLVFENLPEDDPKKRRPDITRAKSILGWEPKVSLEEGLKKSIEYFSKKG